MDAIAPALIGIGIWFAYEAWKNPDPHPLQKFATALGNQASGLGPITPTSEGGTGATATGGVTVNPNTGVARIPGLPAGAQ